jgi:hypothetical protein
MENLEFVVSRKYIEETIKQTLTDDDWEIVRKELVELIDSDLYDRLIDIRWSFDKFIADSKA